MRLMALAFIFEEDSKFKIVVRGAISFGHVISGKNILHCNNSFKGEEDYVKGILLGNPLSKAYSSEKNAPPFGFWIDESVRHFAEKPNAFNGSFWKWWQHSSDKADGSEDIARILSSKLKLHYKWLEENSHSQMYPKDSIKKHQDLADEFFREFSIP